MNVRITLLYLCFFASSLSSFAQTTKISGKVIDSQNQAIEFANVFIQDTTKNALQKGTITDLGGNFEIEVDPNKQYNLVVSFIGFEDWRKTLNPTQSIDLGKIQLTPKINELNEVSVTAKRNIITRKEGKLIFNVATSPLNTGYDGLELLQRSPYVLVDADGNITMRNENPTVMINGRISNLSGADLANYISNLRSENIKSIEVQTHLTANIDGESSGGVINIILKKNPIGFDGNVRSHYTFKRKGFDAKYAGLNLNYGAKKWNIYGLYNYFDTSNQSDTKSTIDYFELQEAVVADEVFTNNYKRQNAQVGLVTNLSKNHVLGIEGNTSDLQYKFDNDGLIRIFEQAEVVEDGTAVVNGSTTNRLYSTTLNYGWTIDTLGSNFKFFADYANQKVFRENTTTSTYENGLLENNIERNQSIANTLIYSAQADFEKYFKLGFKLKTGAKLSYTERENGLESDLFSNEEWIPTGRTNLFNYTEQVSAGYMSISKDFTKSIYLEVGLRVENTDLEKKELQEDTPIFQNYTNWFPNLYLSKEFPKNRSISFSYSKRLRRPPFYFLSNNAVKINDFRYELGNPNLIPENVNNFELSLKDKKQSIDIYLQRVSEAINGIYYLEGQVAYYQKFNEGIQQQLGISYNRFGNLTKWWYIKGRASLYNRKFINGNGDDSFEKLTYGISLNNNFKIYPTTSIDLSGRYRSAYADAYYISYEFYRVNLMVQKTFFNKKLTCRIYFNDVFNTAIGNSERPFENFRTIRSEKWLSQQIQLWASYNFSSKNKVNKRKNESKNEARGRL